MSPGKFIGPWVVSTESFGKSSPKKGIFIFSDPFFLLHGWIIVHISAYAADSNYIHSSIHARKKKRNLNRLTAKRPFTAMFGSLPQVMLIWLKRYRKKIPQRSLLSAQRFSDNSASVTQTKRRCLTARRTFPKSTESTALLRRCLSQQPGSGLPATLSMAGQCS